MPSWRSVATVGAGLLVAVSFCLRSRAEPDWRRPGLDEFEVRVDEGAAEEAAFHKQFYRATRIEKHDPAAARELYRDLLAARPATAYLYFKLAQLDAREGQWPSCIENLETALKHDPKMRAAYNELSRLYSWFGRDEELIGLLEQAVAHIRPDNIEYSLALGELHEEHGRTDAAVEVYERAIAEHPVLYKPWLRLFELRLDAGDEDEAYQTYRRALEETGGHRALLVGVRELYREKHDEERAFELTELLVERFPLNADFWYDDIVGLLALGRFEEARAAFKKSCAYLGGNKKYFAKIVRLYEAHGDPDEAIAVYEYALAVHERLLKPKPANKLSLLAIAEIHEQQGDVEAFGEWARRLLNAHPDLFDAQFAMLRYDELVGKREDADALLAKILGGDEPSPEACIRISAYYLGREEYQRVRDITLKGLRATKRPVLVSHLYLLSGMADYAEHRIPEAARKLKISARHGPDLAETHFYLGLCRRRLGHVEEALEALERAVELAPEDSGWRIELGLTMKRAGRDEEAQKQFEAVITELEAAVEASPESFEAQLALAVALNDVGRSEEAVREFERAIELDPNSATALNGLGYMWAEEGTRLDEALELIERALEIKPESGAIVDSLGWVYFKMGRAEDALRELKRAVGLEPPTAEIYEHLGDTVLALGDEAEAIKWWNKAIELYPDNAEAIRQKIVAHGGVPSTQ